MLVYKSNCSGFWASTRVSDYSSVIETNMK